MKAADGRPRWLHGSDTFGYIKEEFVFGLLSDSSMLMHWHFLLCISVAFAF